MRGLIKVISLIVRRPDLSREEFADHYEVVHAPLALPFLKDLRGYTRNHVRELISGSPLTFDCASEFWYADQAAVERTLRFMASPQSQPLREDELKFMDKPRNVFFSVVEKLVLGDATAFGEKDACKFMVFQGTDTGAETTDSERDLDQQIQGMVGLMRCVQNRPLDSAAFGRITEFWFRNHEVGQQALCSGDIGAGAGSIVSVREVETRCGG